MIDAVARGRRSALALVVLVGMMVALFTACCCLDLDHASAAEPLPVAHVTDQVAGSHDVTAIRDGGHTEEDCQESVTTVAVGSASVPGPLVVAAVLAAASMAGQATPRIGTSGSESSPPPPVPHLLCVMRT